MRRQGGFTLAETMFAVAATGVLVSMAVPAYRDTVLNAHRDGTVMELLAAMQLARSEANRRPAYVTVCPSRDGATCSTSAADWSQGWIVYVNADRTFSGAEPDAGETVLQVFQNAKPGMQISSGNRVAFTFRPFDLNADNGTVTACDARAATQPRQRRAVLISVTGRPRVSDRKTDGSDLDCA